VTSPADMTEETAQALPKTGCICESVARVIAFFLGGQRYALPIERVREIQQIVAFSEVPSGKAGVVGMVNLRGQVIPAVDMRRLVGLDPNEYTLETPMVIAEVRGDVLALIVDEVQDVFELPEDCLQAAPALHELSANMIGIACLSDGLIYVLDIDRLIGAGLFDGSEQ
jgi:purine-binding chemotaxis protein CheW